MLTDRDAGQFRVLMLNADGTVGTDVAGSPLSLGAQPLAIGTNSTGSAAVVTTDANTVIAIPVDVTSGALGSPGPAATTEQTPFAVVVDAQNKFVYVANQMSNSVSAFALGSGASLTPVSDSPYSTGKDPIAVVTTRYD
jgi:DNA-binding beta-propeller fold protein YncE